MKTSRFTFIAALLVCSMPTQAIVVTFDDLPSGIPGALHPIPDLYGGITWPAGSQYCQGDATDYTQGPPNWPELYWCGAPHSGLNDTSTSQFSFPSAVVFNGLWADARQICVASGCTPPPNPILRLDLYLKGQLVAQTSPVSMTFAPQFLASGYNGIIDAVIVENVNPGSVYAGIDDITYNESCVATIAPSTAQNFQTSGGPGSVTVTDGAGCAWTGSSSVPWITITSGASGIGNGAVQYAVQANTANERSGSLTIAGQTLNIQQNGPVSFAAQALQVDGGQGTTQLLEGDTVTFSGSGWSQSGGPITVSLDGRKIGSFLPSNFAGTVNLAFKPRSNPPCAAQLQAVQGSTTRTIDLTGVFLGTVVLAENPDGGAIVSGPGLNGVRTSVGSKVCRTATIQSIFFFLPLVNAGAAFAIEGVSLLDTSVTPNTTIYLGGGVFAFRNNENAAAVEVNGAVVLGPGKTLSLPLKNGRTATLTSTATLPLPASFFIPPSPVNLLPQNLPAGTVLSGFYEAQGRYFAAVHGLSLDNAALYLVNADIDGGFNGVGAIFATGHLNIRGPVLFSAPDQVALAAHGNITFHRGP